MKKQIIQIGVTLMAMALLLKFFYGGGDDKTMIQDAFDNGAPVIDVRTAGEFSDGHFPDAVHIPYQRIADEIAPVAPDKDQPVIVYCRTGSRSGVAKRTLEGLGYTHVLNGGGLSRMRGLLTE